MAVDAKHPDLTERVSTEWMLMRDTAGGEATVKAQGETYLPMPGGFGVQTDGGKAMYSAYKMRAQFPEILAPSISAMVGVIHEKECKIELPPQMDFIRETATREGLGLDAFHRRITRQLLEVGRYGVLAEARINGGDPYLAGFRAEAIINWDEEAEFYVLDETEFKRDGFEWSEFKRYRVLELSEGFYRQRIFESDDPDAPVEKLTESEVIPTAIGGGRMDFVPFVVAGARDVSVRLEPPPLVGVSRAAVAIYQLSADYRHQLFMSGQETLVIINGKAPSAVGASVVMELNGTEEAKPDAKYVGPSGVGIDAHKEAIEDNRKAAMQAGARLFDDTASRQESGDARRLRLGAETATLTSVAQSSCELLQKSLRNVAMIEGLDPETVIVTPPGDLLDTTMTPADAKALMEVWQGGGISYETFYANLLKGGIAVPDRDHEAEAELIEQEDESEDDGDPLEAGLLPIMPGDARTQPEGTEG